MRVVTVPVPAGAGGVDPDGRLAAIEAGAAVLSLRVHPMRPWAATAEPERSLYLADAAAVLDAAEPVLLAALAAAEQRADTLAAENERLQRRLWPDQGHGYANEVERQRVVIDTLRAALSSRPVQPEGKQR